MSDATADADAVLLCGRQSGWTLVADRVKATLATRRNQRRSEAYRRWSAMSASTREVLSGR